MLYPHLLKSCRGEAFVQKYLGMTNKIKTRMLRPSPRSHDREGGVRSPSQEQDKVGGEVNHYCIKLQIAITKGIAEGCMSVSTKGKLPKWR
jgi:hypothetical protein